MTLFILCCTAIAVASLGLCALYLLRIAQEVRAVRKLLQTHWDYDKKKNYIDTISDSLTGRRQLKNL